MFGVNVDDGKPPPEQPCIPVPPVCPPSLPKPNLRGFLSQYLKNRALICAGFILFVGVACRICRVNARHDRYTEFEETWEYDLDFERMKRAGVFQSINTDGSVGDL